MVNGTLIGKRVYLDANPIIYAFENPAEFPGLMSQLLVPLSAGQLWAVTSTVTITEVLNYPIKSGDSTLESAYRQFFVPTQCFEIVPVSVQISELAASLRANFGLRTPDAIHVATSQITNCDIFLTRDLSLKVTGLNVITPDAL